MEIHLAERIYRLFALNPYKALSKVSYRSHEAPYGISPEGYPLQEMTELALRSKRSGEGYEIDPEDQLLQLISPERGA